MKVTRTICDKCRKDIDKDGTELFGMDFCPKCSGDVRSWLKKWTAERIVEEVAEDPKAEPTKNPTKVGRKTNINWDEAVRLKKAGWSNSNIADKLGINVGTVNACIYQKMKEGIDE